MQKSFLTIVLCQLLILAGGCLDNSADFIEVPSQNPYSFVGEMHGDGLSNIIKRIQKEPQKDFHLNYMDLIKFSTVNYVHDKHPNSDTEELIDIVGSVLNDVITSSQSTRTSSNSLFYIIDNYELSDKEKEYLLLLASVIDTLNSGDTIAFDVKIAELTDRVIADNDEEFSTILATIAVAENSKEFWSVEEHLMEWYTTFFELTCLDLGVDPALIDPYYSVDEFLDCATIQHLASADAAGAVAGAIGGAIGGPGGSGTGAIAGGIGASAGLIAYYAVSAAIEWVSSMF